MAKDINLLPQDITEERKRRGRRKSVSVAGYIFLGGCLLLTLIVFVFSLILGRSVSSLNNALAKETEKITLNKALEVDAARLEIKTGALGEIIKARKSYSRLLDVIARSSPEGFKISSLVAAPTGDIQLAGLADSYVILSRFLVNSLDPAAGGVLFSSADLNSVNLDERVGGARFLMTLYLKPNSLSGMAPATAVR